MTNQTRNWEAERAIALAAPVPAATSTYSPVSHAQISEAIRRNLDANNLKLVRSRTYTNKFGTRVVQFHDVEDDTDFGSNNGLKMMLCDRNSYDKSMSVGFAAGASVWVCGNGCISGDIISFRKKHTGDVVAQLDQAIIQGISNMRSEFTRLNMEVDIMKDFDLTPRQKAEILGVMYFERNLVTPTQLSIVKRELSASQHFREDNAWSLYNNVTEALKKSSPVDVITDHIKFHNFMREMTGITVEPVTETINDQPEVEG